MREIIDFRDYNFKLAVINKLMYEQNILQPRFAAEVHLSRQIDFNKEGYDIIPEVQQYFASLPIPLEYLETIEEIRQDGGDEIYMQLIPLWDGEDDLFNIRLADDAALMPKLKSVTLFYDRESNILEQFQQREILAKWL